MLRFYVVQKLLSLIQRATSWISTIFLLLEGRETSQNNSLQGNNKTIKLVIKINYKTEITSANLNVEYFLSFLLSFLVLVH